MSDFVTPDSTPVERRVPPETAPPPAGPRRSGGNAVLWGLFSGCLGLLVMIVVIAIVIAAASESRSGGFIGDRVAVIAVEGEILEARGIIEDLAQYGDNERVKAIVVRINSPGGAIAPSQEIFSEILRVRRENGKPVVASMDSVAASGGYYIAAACDRIVANPGTITGSIGVIAQWYNMEELVRWAKLRPETFTSGKMKDVGSPVRPMTQEERVYMQSIIGELHQQFVRAVAEGRKGKLTIQEVAALADGRVFTGEQAKAVKLVDNIGSLNDAVALAADLGGIDGKPRVIYPHPRRDGLLELLSEMKAPQQLLERFVSANRAPFLYRW